MVGHITEIVGEIIEMVGHGTEMVGDGTEIGRILITSSRRSFSVHQQLRDSVDCISRKQLNRMASKPRLLSGSSTSARGALGRVVVSGVGAEVILRSRDRAVLREMHPGVRSGFHRAREESERDGVPQEAEHHPHALQSREFCAAVEITE
jgi:hypothetical protein